MPDETVGLTQGAGWQIGVQRSVSAPREDVWKFLLSPAGLAVWLGPGARLSPQKGSTYRTKEGTTGEVRSYRELEKIRLSWQPQNRAEPCILQVAVTSNATGTAIRFHQERLASSTERARMRRHWQQVLGTLAARWGG